MARTGRNKSKEPKAEEPNAEKPKAKEYKVKKPKKPKVPWVRPKVSQFKHFGTVGGLKRLVRHISSIEEMDELRGKVSALCYPQAARKHESPEIFTRRVFTWLKMPWGIQINPDLRSARDEELIKRFFVDREFVGLQDTTWRNFQKGHHKMLKQAYNDVADGLYEAALQKAAELGILESIERAILRHKEESEATLTNETHQYWQQRQRRLRSPSPEDPDSIHFDRHPRKRRKLFEVPSERERTPEDHHRLISQPFVPRNPKEE